MTDDTREVIAQLREEIARLNRRCDALEIVVHRQQRRLYPLDALAARVRAVHFWDHSAYDVVPDESFVAVDRTEATDLLGALAEVDHWRPWQTSLEQTP